MIFKDLSLLTDYYQLTMLQGYHAQEKSNEKAVFDLYFRKIPHGGGFCIAAGLGLALRYLSELSFSDEDLDYLRQHPDFKDDFLSYLKDFRFEGDVYAVPEGTIVFPNEPLLRIHATLPQAQLVESALLNILNFQTLVATKAARMVVAAKGGSILEFGLRRSQGIDGAISATRAAYIGGCDATSNTLAGKMFDIPVRGTHAHSWVMAFPDELSAFRAYAEVYPESCTLLVDTYDTLESGVPNAIKVAQELQERGHQLRGIRLDSGDLAYLSKKARQMLDEAGFPYVKIIASNDLDEYLISNLISQGAKIDIWGVGTNLVTSKGEPALGGVYKLAASQDKGQSILTPRIKLSSNPAKTTIPGVKQVWRALDKKGHFVGDVLHLNDESNSFSPPANWISHHPLYANSLKQLHSTNWQPLLQPVIRGGKVIQKTPELKQSREFTLENLTKLPGEHKRRINPHLYWIGLSEELNQMRSMLVRQYLTKSYS